MIINWLANNWMSLLALIIAIVAAYFAFDQNKIAKKLSHLHIIPEVKSMFIFPLKGNPIYSIINTGDIPIVSLSVEHSMYVFDKKVLKITTASKMGYMFGDRMIFTEELYPTQIKKQELMGVNPVQDRVIVYKFDLKYYRSTDMTVYKKQEIFFVDDGVVIKHSDYRKNTNYFTIMTGIENTTFPSNQYDPDKLKNIIENLDKDKKGLQERKK